MDNVLAAKRKHIMAQVRSQNTKPEMAVRKLVYSLGYRYRLHRKDLPGKPDLAFPSQYKAIFVHGCFWHGHDCRAGRNRPSSNQEYWHTKLEKNKERDKKNLEKLSSLGWSTLVVWECEVRNKDELEIRIEQFLKFPIL